MTNPRISVCVCTFRRPLGLARLLRSLERQCPETPPFEVVVVDNDAGRSAGTICEAAVGRGLDLRYEVEPIQNIARARNRSVRAARAGLVGFIDDDCTAGSRWLVELLHGVEQHGADGGFGVVQPVFADGGRSWIRRGGFFLHSVPPTGSTLAWYQTRTDNALVRRQFLEEDGFDESFGLTGGEDVELFNRLLRRGARLIAVDSAPVHSHIPAERVSMRWLLRRRFNNGLICTRVLASSMSPEARRVYAWRELGLAARHAAGSLSGLAISPARGFEEVLRATECAGRVACFAGVLLHPYRAKGESR